MSLLPEEINRYSQQLKLDHVGLEGQLKLKNARVLCIGAGGLGSSVLLHLASAGVGTIGIVDNDVVELSNLQRQILYQNSQIGYKKAIIAKQQLFALNPNIDIYAYTERFNINNANELINQYDIIADCSDNFATRYLINDICYLLNKPYAFASIYQFEGQCSLFLSKKTPCFRCLYSLIPIADIAPDCSEGGVLGVLPGLFGVIQATEIIKWILKIGNSLAGHLLSIDILKMQFRTFQILQNPECSLCVLQQPLELLIPVKTCSSLHSISVKELQQNLTDDENILLLDVRSIEEHKAYNLGGILIPLSELRHRLTELNLNKQIIVYCQSGRRSAQAVKLLIEANLNAICLEGGVFEWRRALD
jgi:sulfur-carrier protein adenylyltransferase/sulfurtransferase